MKKEYAKQKQSYLEKTGKENVTFNYLNKNRDQVGNTLNFIMSTISKQFKESSQTSKKNKKKKAEGLPENVEEATENSDHLITTLMSHQYLYSYFVYLNSLISSYKDIKHALFYMLSDPNDPEDTQESVWKKADEHFFSLELKNKINDPARKEANKTILSMVYYLYTVLG